MIKYEISSVLYNRKPTSTEISRNYGFKKNSECAVVDGQANVLYKVYSNGYTVKPHAGKMSDKALCIVLDFDNITKQQAEFLDAICNGKYKFGDAEVYGDYSVGTKSRLKEHENDKDYINPKWGYKIFWPCECLVTSESLEKVFIDAVAFFNPSFSLDKVEETWNAWKKCNNNHSSDSRPKTSDKIFDGWILPDVAMWRSYRTQITYAVNVNQIDFTVKLKPTEAVEQLAAIGVSADIATTTKKSDWTEHMWHIDETLEESFLSTPANGMHLHTVFPKEVIDSTDTHLLLPTSKHKFAKFTQKQVFKRSLVLPFRQITELNYLCFCAEHESFDMHTAKKRAGQIGLMLGRIVGELLYTNTIFQTIDDEFRAKCAEFGNSYDPITSFNLAIDNSNTLTEQSNTYGRMAKHDFVVIFKRIYGTGILKSLEEKSLKEVLSEFNARFVWATSEYPTWRDSTFIGQSLSDNNAVKAAYRRMIDTDDAEEYEKTLSEEMMKIETISMTPYIYKNRNVKSVAIDYALAEDVKLDTIEKFTDFVVDFISAHVEEYGIFDKEDVKKWYRDYRNQYNKTHNLDVIRKKHKTHKTHKKHKKHESKWSKLFDGKTKEEIEKILDNSDISAQLKYKLKNEYVRN